MLEWDKHIATYREEGAILLTCLEDGCGWVYSGPRGNLMAEGHLQMEHPRVMEDA